MVDTQQHAVGTRKRAVAKVWVKPGEGKLSVNGKTIEEYLKRADLIMRAYRPLELTGTKEKYDIKVRTNGGGVAAQAEAISLAISRALVKISSEMHKPLKDKGLLTRDPREKERMKYGLAKRRKSFQWTKR